MNIIWLFLGALVISIGWFTGRCIVYSLDEFARRSFNNSKIVKAYRSKKRKTNYKKPCLHETKIGF